MSDGRHDGAAVVLALRRLHDAYRRDGEAALAALEPAADPLDECRSLLAATGRNDADEHTVEARELLAALEATLVAAPHPLPDSYWVVPGRLLAGEYPGARVPDETRRQLRRLRWCGVREFVDLTEAGEYGLAPYLPLLDGAARHRRFPVPDRDVPDETTMHAILDGVDAALAAGATVYVHCFGGIGRTGTVIGCWLVRHGRPADEALRRIAEWRLGTPAGWCDSPETPEQRAFVRAWREAGPAGPG